MLTGLELSISTVSNQKSIETTTTNALCFAKTVEASLAPLGWLLLSPRMSVTGQMHIISASTVATRVCFWADAVSFPLLLSPRASVTGQMQHHFRYWADAVSFPLLPSPHTSVFGQMQHHPPSSGPPDTMPHCVPLDIAFFFPQGLKKGKKKIALKQKSNLMGKKISSTFVH